MGLILYLFFNTILTQAQTWEEYNTHAIPYLKEITKADDRVEEILLDIRNMATTFNKNLPPTYISVGGIVRCQKDVGACFGYQFNIGKDKHGKWVITKYRLIALFLGVATVAKVELYIAACFGNCMEGYNDGWFITGDIFTTIPVTGIINRGLFFEMGLDVTDGLLSIFNPKENGTIYIGGGIDLGAGYGISGGIYKYKKLFKKELKDLDINDLLML